MKMRFHSSQIETEWNFIFLFKTNYLPSYVSRYIQFDLRLQNIEESF